MEELQSMLSHLLPTNWNWVKWTFLALGAGVWWGVALHKRREWHAALQGLVFVGMVALFAYGVATRGLLGNVPNTDHTPLFWTVLFLHVGCGFVYLVLGGVQIVSGIRVMRRSPEGVAGTLRSHRNVGIWSRSAITLSVLMSLPL